MADNGPEFRVILTHPSGPGDEERISLLKVEEVHSMQVVFELELTSAQLHDLMSTRFAYPRTHRLGKHPERWGKRLVHKSVHLDRKEWGLEYNSTEDHPVIQAHLKTLREIEGWEVVQWECKRGQHAIRCTKWVDAEPADG